MPPRPWLLAACLFLGRADAEPVRVINQGVGGNSTKDALARYQRDVLDHPPDHLVLFFGVNDACNSSKLVPIETFRENLARLVETSPTRSVVLVTPPPILEAYLAERHPNHPQRDRLGEHLDQYVEAVRRCATERELPLADLRERIEAEAAALDGPDSLLRCEANGGGRDGVHLTADGYRVLAELVAEALGDRVRPGETVLCFGDSITFGAHMKGAGTSTGETYPAWLGWLLNRKLGLTDAAQPEEPAAE